MRVWLDQARDSEGHMAKDLWRAEQGSTGIRLFLWKPAAFSIGWNQPMPHWLKGARTAGLTIVRRPTGGGLACHGTDVSYARVEPCSPQRSIQDILSAVCESARATCRAFDVKAAVAIDVPGRSRITVCLAEPSSYAVLVGGRKLAGFAVRRIAGNWLIQGSLLGRPLPKALLQWMPASLQERFRTHAVSLSEASGRALDEAALAERWAMESERVTMEQVHGHAGV